MQGTFMAQLLIVIYFKRHLNFFSSNLVEVFRKKINQQVQMNIYNIYNPGDLPPVSTIHSYHYSPFLFQDELS